MDGHAAQAHVGNPTGELCVCSDNKMALQVEALLKVIQLSTDPAFALQQPSAANACDHAEETLTDKAERCRRLAAGISDRQAADVLRSMALQYEDSASRQTS